jgi:hypothetical protein
LVLDDIGIDVLAKRELFALAQYGDAGHLAANAIIGKLLKGESERKMYTSRPSAWLHSVVLTERHRLRPDGAKHFAARAVAAAAAIAAVAMVVVAVAVAHLTSASGTPD